MTHADSATGADQSTAKTPAGPVIPGFYFEFYPDLVAWLAHLSKGGRVKPDDMSMYVNWMKPFEIERGFAAAATGHLPSFGMGTNSWPGAAEQKLFFDSLRPVIAGAFDVNGWNEGLKLHDAMSKFEEAQSAMRSMQSKLAQLYEQNWKEAQARFLEEMKAKRERDESFTGIVDALGAWTKTLSAVAHEVLPSPAAVELFTEAMHCVSRLRLAQSHLTEVVSEYLNVPTRSEMDEAYRLIHELRREIRAMKQRD